VMKQGEVLQIGTPTELLNSPAHPYVSQLVEMPRLRADRLEQLLRGGRGPGQCDG
jgi:ABC-type proline/glycine betaine transport system ATPase subunit